MGRALTAAAKTGGLEAKRRPPETILCPLLLRFINRPSSSSCWIRSIIVSDPRAVELIETHISWVFLTDRFAYKLKKPVHFSFLDFSTVAKRHRACLDELRLNRRLAGDVYLDVLPIGQRAGGDFVWGDRGEVVDWVVKSRRLPDAACLQKHLVRGQLAGRAVDALAQFLADFYRQQPPLTLRPEQTRSRLVQWIRDNQGDLSECVPDEIHRINAIHAGQLRYVATHIALLDSRVCDGRYIEGHGDLRPEHVYLLPQPVVIDCIEFSSELRGVDIVDDLSFLAMECDRLSRPDVGACILQTYRTVVGDQPPASLLAFYKSYRACVRAKVNALRATQETGEARAESMKRVVEYLAHGRDPPTAARTFTAGRRQRVDGFGQEHVGVSAGGILGRRGTYRRMRFAAKSSVRAHVRLSSAKGVIDSIAATPCIARCSSVVVSCSKPGSLSSSTEHSAPHGSERRPNASRPNTTPTFSWSAVIARGRLPFAASNSVARTTSRPPRPEQICMTSNGPHGTWMALRGVPCESTRGKRCRSRRRRYSAAFQNASTQTLATVCRRNLIREPATARPPRHRNRSPAN